MHEQILANQRRAFVLVVLMAILLGFLGYALGEYVARGAGTLGIAIALIVVVIQALISYYKGDSIVLAISHARKIQKSDHPILFNVVEEMCVASGVSQMPDIYIIDDDALNAFATGRDPQHASLAVTAGLLKELDRDELQGVIGHELGHVKNRDVLYMTFLAVMLGTIILLAAVGRRVMFQSGSGSRTSSRRGKGGGAAAIILIVAILLIILAPVLAQLLYFAVSRRREYLADASSALYTRYPEGLASALEKLGHSTKKLQSATPAVAPMYIVNPLQVTANGLSDLSSTHPPISERIRILRSMGARAGLTSYNEAFRKVTGRPVGVVAFAEAHAQPDVPVMVPAAAAAAAVFASDRVDRVRQTTDALWSVNDYIFIECPCGTRLKVPPAYAGKRIECPHCGREHVATRAA
jgi:heat shock protein HtpX